MCRLNAHAYISRNSVAIARSARTAGHCCGAVIGRPGAIKFNKSNYAFTTMTTRPVTGMSIRGSAGSVGRRLQKADMTVENWRLPGPGAAQYRAARQPDATSHQFARRRGRQPDGRTAPLTAGRRPDRGVGLPSRATSTHETARRHEAPQLAAVHRRHRRRRGIARLGVSQRVHRRTMSWLQLRFDFDSTRVRRSFDWLSKVIKFTVT